MYRFISRFNAQLKSLGLLLILGVLIGCSEFFSEMSEDTIVLFKSCEVRWNPFAAMQRPVASVNTQQLHVYLSISLNGVYTPTTTASGSVKFTTASGALPPVFDDLAANGYVALRVPHAPPTYTTSSLIGGISSSPAVKFSYFLPPTATIRTTVPITVTRRTDLEPAVNSRWPITDGHSHWEVWWLPPGDQFPIPDRPFQLKGTWPQPIEIAFRIDFGADAGDYPCAGCLIEAVAYNGYAFIGPYTAPIVLNNNPLPVGNPLVGFGTWCGSPSIVQEITSTVPFTQTHWLESYDTLTRTFTINAASSRGWNYTYFYQIGDNLPVAVAGPPFNVTLGPKPNTWSFASCAQIMAVYTPTLAANDAVRETFNITATPTVSPAVWASSISFTLGPAYTLNEGGGYRVLLPLVVKLN